MIKRERKTKKRYRKRNDDHEKKKMRTKGKTNIDLKALYNFLS